jgi:DNA-binding MurR/RpiR family transcriptional regulator
LSVLQMISVRLTDMAPADQQIGEFILEQPDQVAKLSSAALAQATGRSQSSVVKFSQKLGFAGFQELKRAVIEAKAQEWRVPAGIIHGSIEKDDGYLTILQKLIGSKLQSMQQTVAVNNEDDIGKALTALDAARRIHLAGVGASSLVARDFSYKLMKIGRFVMHNDDSHIQMANASILDDKDILVAFSQSGTSIETLHIAEAAAKQGALIISVTGLKENKLASLANINLYTVADEEKVRSSSITSRDAQLILTDLLFLLLVQRQSNAHDYIRKSESAVASLKTKA